MAAAWRAVEQMAPRELVRAAVERVEEPVPDDASGEAAMRRQLARSGQQEMLVRAPVPRAADNHVLHRETAHGVTMRHLWWLSVVQQVLQVAWAAT